MKVDRWIVLMEGLGLASNERTFDQLLRAYSEKHRRYHTAAHVDACLRHFDRCVRDMAHSWEVELAIWFHDAVYKPLSSRNERASADWAAKFLAANGVSGPTRDRIDGLIMATCHSSSPGTADESLLVDIDLAILGADAESYDRFEQAIRGEYRMVPWSIYRNRRIEILAGFLRQPRIYHNEPFCSEREQQARANITRAISTLQHTRPTFWSPP